MIGIIETPFGFLDTYDLAINLGIVISFIVLFVMYLKSFKKIKVIVYLLCYGGILLLGRNVSSFVRSANDGKLSSPKVLWDSFIHPYSSHLIGHVICFGILYYIFAFFLRNLVGELTGIELSSKQEIIRLGNITALVLPIQHIFNRLACVFRGCCYGIPYDGFCSVRFPNNQDVDHSVFPCQFLEIFFMVILLIILIILIKHEKNTVGATLIGFAITFFISEFFIYTPDEYKYHGFTFVQFAAIICLAIGLIYIICWDKIVSRKVSSVAAEDKLETKKQTGKKR